MSKPNSKRVNKKRMKRKVKKCKSRKGDYSNQYYRSYAGASMNMSDQIRTLESLDKLRGERK